MKRILLLSYRICFPIALTAVFLFLLPRFLFFFLPFTLGAILALLAEPLIKLAGKALPFLKKESTVGFGNPAFIFIFGRIALSFVFTWTTLYYQ